VYAGFRVRGRERGAARAAPPSLQVDVVRVRILPVHSDAVLTIRSYLIDRTVAAR
jgi:hypothetical protein